MTEKRKQNLILHNIVEPASVSQADLMRKDGEAFSDLTKEEFNLNVKITKAIRLGRKSGDKRRLLLVTLESAEDRRNILRLAKTLRRSATRSDVYIQPDETQKEREISRDLRAALKVRRDEG